MRTAACVLLSLFLAFVEPRAAGLQSAAKAPARAAASPQRPLPPISYSCPMHAEVVDDKPGACPICKMTLEPVRLELVWTCPEHKEEISETQAGRCRICGRDLIKVIKALRFVCPVHKDVSEIEPGRCPKCKRTLVGKYIVRPHGDHNPKHGGNFFMASNNWHIEATHPAAEVVRLYVYDNYSKPFVPSALTARIVELMPPGGVSTRPTPVDVTLKRVPGKEYFEGRVPNLTVPAILAMKIRFEAADKEYRFDFYFIDYTKEPPPPPRRPR
jgi:hypothetical protein